MEKKPTSVRMLESLFECEQPVESLTQWRYEAHQDKRERSVRSVTRTLIEQSAPDSQQEVSELSR